jgi:hypothetical protein
VSLACWGYSIEYQTPHSFRSRGCDGPPSLLPRHVGWIDVVDVWAQSPLIVSEALDDLDGEKSQGV